MNILLETATTNGAGGSAFFFAWMGVATGLVFANLGSAYGTAKAGVGLMSMGVMNPGAVMKNVLPIILAAVLGIYGLIVAIIISSNGKYILYIYIYSVPSHGKVTLSNIFFIHIHTHKFEYIVSKVQTAISKGDITGGMNIGYKLFCAGLCCGLSSLASGFAIGIVGDAGVRAVGQSPKLYVGMVLVMIFAEAIGLYGLIIALVLGTS
jgi:V-type H+-transporting ATPase 16kDa proteolipid subunit